jgi:hypothetical protein
MEKGTIDAGGVAMKRDGLLSEMTRARLEAVDRLRELRTARQGVLTAQRESEWASEERHMSAQKLDQDREGLKNSRREVTKWKLDNEKKLKAMRARAREQRQERQKAERKLEEAERKHAKAQRKLQVAEANISDFEIDDDNNITEEADEVWQLRRDVEQRGQAVEDAEKLVEKTKTDSEWLDHDLRRKVKTSQSSAKRSREELLESRARERVSGTHLEEAKEAYFEAVKESKQADKAAQEAERKLRAAPLSASAPDESVALAGKAVNKSEVVEDASLRSSAPNVFPTAAVSVLLCFLAQRMF